MSNSEQEWTLPAQLGQLKTGQDGKGLLRIHLWCPDDLPRLWDRIEKIDSKHSGKSAGVRLLTIFVSAHLLRREP